MKFLTKNDCFKKSFLMISVFLMPFLSVSQNGFVKGKIVDTTQKQNLAYATVSVLTKSDSSIVAFSISDKNGFFEIAGLDRGEYILSISFNGYENVYRSFSITKEKKGSDAGEIVMKRNIKELEGVLVTDNAPVRLHGDTISFKVNAFNNNPNATAEDILKKIPGIQVQKDGTINAMGQTVQKVFVNGKEFFGNDPKMATRNITADMIDQVQVFDDMSEQARFTKIDDGSKTKTINLKLKKDKSIGDFGRLTVGGGTDERFEGILSYNRFNDERQISIVGSASNTNKQSYSFSDMSSQGGMMQFSQSGSGKSAVAGNTGGNGISSTQSTGINYNDFWGKKIDFRGSYTFSGNEYHLNQQSLKNYSFPGDSSSEQNTYSNTTNRNNNHRINSRIEFKIDSVNSLLYTASLSLQEFDSHYSDTLNTISSGVNAYKVLSGKAARNDNRDGVIYSGDLLFRHRFRVPGRTFTLGWRNGHYENNSGKKNLNQIKTYSPAGSVLHFLNSDQQDKQNADNMNNIINATYTEPAGKNKLIEFNYSYSANKNVSDKKTFDYNPVTGNYDMVNLLQTNLIEYDNTSNRIGSNYVVQKTKYNYQFGTAVQHSKLENRSKDAATGKDTITTQRFLNFFPAASFNYNLSRSERIRVYYRGNTNAPSVNQLQDVIDYSNPLQIKTGNPSLKQEFQSNINAGYSTFNPRTFLFFNADISLNITGKKIVNAIDSAGPVAIIIKPENINGSFSTSGTFSFGFPFRRWKGSNLNITTMAFYNRDAGMIYKKKNFTTLMMLNQTFSFSYSKSNFDLGLSANLVYNNVKYDFRGKGNTKFLNQAWSADFTYRFAGGFFMLTDMDYMINSGRAEGFNQDVFLWNISIAKLFLKTKAAEIKLTAYDVLNENQGINRTTGFNYFEDTRSNVVSRFFLLSFTYHLKQKALRKLQLNTKQEPMRVFQ
jgi:hypothetical protein